MSEMHLVRSQMYEHDILVFQLLQHKYMRTQHIEALVDSNDIE
jgi:hypothetical protein